MTCSLFFSKHSSAIKDAINRYLDSTVDPKRIEKWGECGQWQGETSSLFLVDTSVQVSEKGENSLSPLYAIKATISVENKNSPTPNFNCIVAYFYRM